MKKTKMFWHFAFAIIGAALIFFSNCKKNDDDLPSIVRDIDGNVYKTVTIGNQEWFAENLRTTKYNNGTAIPNITDNTEWTDLSTGAYAIYPHSQIDGLNSETEVLAAYGILYNFYAVDDARGLCPTGWRVPTDADWTQLLNYLADQGYPNSDVVDGAGNALKSCLQVNSPLGVDCATSEHPRWKSHSTHYGTDAFGFSALPGGYSDSNGIFFNIGYYGIWWCSTETSSSGAGYRNMNYAYGNVLRYGSNKKDGFSVRCVRGYLTI